MIVRALIGAVLVHWHRVLALESGAYPVPGLAGGQVSTRLQYGLAEQAVALARAVASSEPCSLVVRAFTASSPKRLSTPRPARRLSTANRGLLPALRCLPGQDFHL